MLVLQWGLGDKLLILVLKCDRWFRVGRHLLIPSRELWLQVTVGNIFPF